MGLSLETDVKRPSGGVFRLGVVAVAVTKSQRLVFGDVAYRQNFFHGHPTVPAGKIGSASWNFVMKTPLLLWFGK